VKGQEVKLGAPSTAISAAGNQCEQLEVRRSARVGKPLTTQYAVAGGEMDVIAGPPPSVRCCDRQNIGWITDDLAAAHSRHDPVLIDSCYGCTGSERRDRGKHDPFELCGEASPEMRIQLGQSTRIRNSRAYESVLAPPTHQASGADLPSPSAGHAEQERL
jgi:hypothetical protein